MLHLNRNHKIMASRFGMIVTAFVLILWLGSCNQTEKPNVEKAEQKTFASPEDAGAAFLDAAKSGDQAALACDLRSGR